MRKRLLALVLMLIAAINTFAYDFESKGIYYNILSEEEHTCEVAKPDDSYYIFSMKEHTCEVTYGSGNHNGYSGDIVIPSVVQYGAMSYTVVGIGKYAFQEIPFLEEERVTSVCIPSSVTTIGAYAFSGCTSLTSLSGIPSSITTIEAGTFKGCTGLTSLVGIPSSVTTIGESAFSGCTGLTSLSGLPSGVTTIGGCAFSGCTGLTSLSGFPSGITTIEHGTFSDCTGLTSLSGLPSSVTTIEWSAFSGCTGLTSLSGLPSGITTIENGAFSGCTGLTSLSGLPSGITTIEDGTFSGCTGLTSLSGLPSSVTTIGRYAFDRCTGLTSLSGIPSSVTTIENDAFAGCRGLTSACIPPKVEMIDDNVFYNCSSLEEIRFLGSVPQILHTEVGYGDMLFRTCDKLLSVALSTSCGWKNIPKDRFVKVTFVDGYDEQEVTYWKDWTKLEYIVSHGTTPPKIGDSFTEFQKWNIRVRVPSSALAAYQNTPVWKDFYFLNGGAETLGITDVETEDENSVKCPIYDLNGVRVDNPVPGHVYIRNGKKYVIGRH